MSKRRKIDAYRQRQRDAGNCENCGQPRGESKFRFKCVSCGPKPAERYRARRKKLLDASIEAGHTVADYEACLQFALSRGYRAMYNSMKEDGYDQKVDWRNLMKPPAPEVPKV